MTTALCQWGNHSLNLLNNSILGDKHENRKGDYVLIDSKTLKVTGKWFLQVDVAIDC